MTILEALKNLYGELPDANSFDGTHCSKEFSFEGRCLKITFHKVVNSNSHPWWVYNPEEVEIEKQNGPCLGCL